MITEVTNEADQGVLRTQRIVSGAAGAQDGLLLQPAVLRLRYVSVAQQAQ